MRSRAERRCQQGFLVWGAQRDTESLTQRPSQKWISGHWPWGVNQTNSSWRTFCKTTAHPSWKNVSVMKHREREAKLESEKLTKIWQPNKTSDLGLDVNQKNRLQLRTLLGPLVDFQGWMVVLYGCYNPWQGWVHGYVRRCSCCPELDNEVVMGKRWCFQLSPKCLQAPQLLHT